MLLLLPLLNLVNGDDALWLSLLLILLLILLLVAVKNDDDDDDWV